MWVTIYEISKFFFKSLEISLVGMGSKFELWNLENWEKKQSGLQIPGEDLLEDLPAVLEEIPF